MEGWSKKEASTVGGIVDKKDKNMFSNAGHLAREKNKGGAGKIDSLAALDVLDACFRDGIIITLFFSNY